MDDGDLGPPAPGIAMVTIAGIEECTGPTHVGLVGAVAGERYCLPENGMPPDFLVLVQKFPAEGIINRYLVRLIKTEEGWALHRDAETGAPVLSSAVVSAFIGKDKRPYQHGSLARIANDEGNVLVKFGDAPLLVHFEDKACADVEGIGTPPSDDEHFRLE